VSTNSTASVTAATTTAAAVRHHSETYGEALGCLIDILWLCFIALALVGDGGFITDDSCCDGSRDNSRSSCCLLFTGDALLLA
jgi:hypothetical protein